MANTETVFDAISRFFEESRRPVLFAGAGVSVRAGLPTWGQYLKDLAEQVRPADQLTRHQMLECVHRRQYTLAAEYFFLSEGLTDGEKNKAITAPLDRYDATLVAAISDLPFSSYVTTNYDRVLLDSYAKRFEKAAVEVNLSDPTMTAAPFMDTFYIARIHGRVEVPSSMVLSKTHYERLYRETAYIDFLRHLFSTRSLLFVGFSFLDPAIQAVLKLVRDQVGSAHSGNHLALVDSGAEVDFLAELNRHNIRAATYNATDSHFALWDGLFRYSKNSRAKNGSPDAAQSDAFSHARQYFAAALTRRKMSSHMRPLKQAVAEGMVLEMLASSGATGLSREEITFQLSSQLNLQAAACAPIVDSSLQGLAVDSLYSVDDAGRFKASSASAVQGSMQKSIAILVEGAIHRLIVREHGSDCEPTRKLLGKYFEYMVLRRGWDMGAAYAARRPPQAVVVEELLGRLNADNAESTPPSRKLVRAIEDVLLSPSDAEAVVLAELGRMAFALELVRQVPQDTLFSSHVLPTRIYLDANVLMPAIVHGHPYNALYSAAMEKLLAASAATSSGLEVSAYFGFLNEVVSHRRLARDNITGYGARAAEHIEREVRLYGAANMNVFIAGFARTLISGEKMSFDEYLRRFAPYDSEAKLASWLRSKGLRIIEQKQMLAGAVDHPAILHHFEVVFAQEISSKTRTATLLAHDALQVARLKGDVARGDRAVFVSADRRLRDAVACSNFRSIGSAMMSGVGLVQMIDLLVGAIGDDRSIASLLWSTRASSPAERVRHYLVDIALSQYDAALAMNMESIVRELTEDITSAMENDRAGSMRNEEEDLALGKYVEAFEPKFYESMKAEQQRLSAGSQ